MSTKSKLLAMTENLQLDGPANSSPASDPEIAAAAAPAVPPGASSGIRFPPVSTGPLPRTGPGQMLQFRGQILAAEGELGKLRERLKEHEGSSPTRKIDPSLVIPSRWANRHADSFASPEFARLKQDIETAGGNVQAISVRPIEGDATRYEIVFGHRRHRACLELGIPVLATVDTSAVSDAELFSAMDRENRERADLSPYEQGMMYRRALDEKLYPSNRRLAEALGVSHTWVANVLQVADLPAPLVECFRSPLEIQHRHARALAVAYEADRKAVLRRADKLRQQGRPQAPGVVVDLLLATPPKSGADNSTLQTGVISADGRRFGEWSRDKAGRLVITLEADAVAAGGVEALIESIAKRLAD